MMYESQLSLMTYQYRCPFHVYITSSFNLVGGTHSYYSYVSPLSDALQTFD